MRKAYTITNTTIVSLTLLSKFWALSLVQKYAGNSTFVEYGISLSLLMWIGYLASADIYVIANRHHALNRYIGPQNSKLIKAQWGIYSCNYLVIMTIATLAYVLTGTKYFALIALAGIAESLNNEIYRWLVISSKNLTASNYNLARALIFPLALILGAPFQTGDSAPLPLEKILLIHIASQAIATIIILSISIKFLRFLFFVQKKYKIDWILLQRRSLVISLGSSLALRSIPLIERSLAEIILPSAQAVIMVYVSILGYALVGMCESGIFSIRARQLLAFAQTRQVKKLQKEMKNLAGLALTFYTIFAVAVLSIGWLPENIKAAAASFFPIDTQYLIFSFIYIIPAGSAIFQYVFVGYAKYKTILICNLSAAGLMLLVLNLGFTTLPAFLASLTAGYLLSCLLRVYLAERYLRSEAST